MSRFSKRDMMSAVRGNDSVPLCNTALQTVYTKQDHQEKLLRSDERDGFFDDYERAIDEASTIMEQAMGLMGFA